MPLPHVRHIRRASADVAWVQGEGRVVLIDLTHLEVAEPLVCTKPAASLWRALAESPQTLDELASVTCAQ